MKTCLNTPYCILLLNILKSLNFWIQKAHVQRMVHNMILQLPSADTTTLCAETKGQVAQKNAPCFVFSILMTLKKVSLNVLTACKSPIGTLTLALCTLPQLFCLVHLQRDKELKTVAEQRGKEARGVLNSANVLANNFGWVMFGCWFQQFWTWFLVASLVNSTGVKN